MEKRFTLDAEKLRRIDGNESRDVSRISVRVHVRIVEQFLNFSPRWGRTDGRTSHGSRVTKQISSSCLTFSFYDGDSTTRDTRRRAREGRVKKGRACWFIQLGQAENR